MRDLLRNFADDGGTVLLSSHLLHEIEIVADDIVVIGNGRIVAQGTKGELLRAAGTIVRADDLGSLARALSNAGYPGVAQDGALRTDADPALVGKIAFAAALPLTELRSADGAGLEEMFLELTADTQREGAAA
jgi:ABC-2 type transport system ATP-binding protein